MLPKSYPFVPRVFGAKTRVITNRNRRRKEGKGNHTGVLSVAIHIVRRTSGGVGTAQNRAFCMPHDEMYSAFWASVRVFGYYPRLFCVVLAFVLRDSARFGTLVWLVDLTS